MKERSRNTSNYTISIGEESCGHKIRVYFDYNEDLDMGFVLPKVVQAPAIKIELIKTAK